ncbi:MAG TPA: 4-hydroxythreonine-4-phosphate dehydrogenase PdxA, partial [Longimicrobiales bacterium]
MSRNDSHTASGRRVRLAVTLGDPRGIGPEVTAAAAALAAADRNAPDLIFVGPAGTHPGIPDNLLRSTGEWNGTTGINGGDPAAAGQLAGRAIEAAATLALDGDVDGIVTAPIDKGALHAGGYYFPGHTEMLASITNDAEVVMMMAAEKTALGGPLRVVLA